MTNKKILCFSEEKNPKFDHDLTNILESSGYSVTESENTSHLLTQIEKNKPSTIIFNLLDDYNKSHFLKRIKDSENIFFNHENQGTLTKKEESIEKELWKALDNNEFELYYQPVIDISQNKLFGFESLIRWNHPTRGLVPPDDFIPVAEKSPVIIPLGYWIIEEAAKQSKEWSKQFPNQDFRINVNLSPKQFVHEKLNEIICEIIEKHDIKTSNIGIEITESAFMDDMKSANLMLLQFKSENFSIYMDDFGTGFSSLSYLTHFPVDIIKIDKSFVEWMHIDEQSEAIVKSIVDLAHNLNMKVVAEGVEEEEHLEMLKNFKADYSQGYLHSKPMPNGRATDYIINFN